MTQEEGVVHATAGFKIHAMLSSAMIYVVIGRDETEDGQGEKGVQG
jgi:hypothetical protein